MNSSQAIAARTLDGPVSGAVGKALLVAFGVALLIVSAKIKVPLWPNPTPVTLQTLAIFSLSAAYGSRLAVSTVLSYLLLGAAGAPVFTGTPESGIGIVYMAGPTGGYLAGFLVMAAITGFAADRGLSENPFKLGGFMLVGETIMLVMGALWMGYLFGSDKIIAWGIGPFIVTDLIKLALAAAIVPAMWVVLRKVLPR
jgi:biotin transport system substrate-specific component